MCLITLVFFCLIASLVSCPAQVRACEEKNIDLSDLKVGRLSVLIHKPAINSIIHSMCSLLLSHHVICSCAVLYCTVLCCAVMWCASHCIIDSCVYSSHAPFTSHNATYLTRASCIASTRWCVVAQSCAPVNAKLWEARGVVESTLHPSSGKKTRDFCIIFPYNIIYITLLSYPWACLDCDAYTLLHLRCRRRIAVAFSSVCDCAREHPSGVGYAGEHHDPCLPGL
jgi:hypothetical protein